MHFIYKEKKIHFNFLNKVAFLQCRMGRVHEARQRGNSYLLGKSDSYVLKICFKGASTGQEKV